MNPVDRRDSIADPILSAAMADLRDDFPEAVDWDHLRRSINERAALTLARRRSRRMAFIPRPLVQIAMAASIAFALWVGPDIYQDVFGTSAEFALGVDQEEILLQALGGDLSEQEFRNLVSGKSNPEVLLAVAIGAR